MNKIWFSERLPALRGCASAPELVLLHGWGMSSEVWRSWLPLLRRRCNVTLLDLPGFGRSPFQPGLNETDLLDQLIAYIPKNAVLLGWSLGGMLALAFGARYPQHCAALMTIACNPSFVVRPDWLAAMPVGTLDEFQAALVENPKVATLRFLSLQTRGADRERELLKGLREIAQSDIDPAALTWGLNLLRNLDVRIALRDYSLPAMHIYGVADALVPAAVAEQVAAMKPQNIVALLDGASHLPFITCAELCWQHLDRLLVDARLLVRRAPPQRDKKAVALSFSRAAASYDGAAVLQRNVAEQLLAQAKMPVQGNVLDLGCGTGFIGARLAGQHQVFALDLAEGMVIHGRSQHAASNLHWLCADAENLPLADASMDSVLSSLAVQWCENIDAVFAELRRVLRPGGSAWIATLGPDTLSELRAAWTAADDRVHVNRFADRATIERAVQRARLTTASWHEQISVMEYTELRELTRELKALGAHNINAGRPDGLTGRRRLQNFMSAYETRRNTRGLLPATYQVWFLQLRKEDDA